MKLNLILLLILAALSCALYRSEPPKHANAAEHSIFRLIPALPAAMHDAAQ